MKQPAKLILLNMSLTEEFSIAKARIFLMIRDSNDQTVRSARPEVSSGKKWQVAEAAEEAESM